MSKIIGFLTKLNKCLDFLERKKLDSNSLVFQQLLDKKPYWLILKCSKCHRKSIPMLSGERIKPVNKYCRHCGSEKFFFEKKQNIERLDTIYALYSKDISNVRKEMVSVTFTPPEGNCLDDCENQKKSKFSPKEKVSILNNVVPFDRRQLKGI